jgi:zinc transport system substrate-binding protein
MIKGFRFLVRPMVVVLGLSVAANVSVAKVLKVLVPIEPYRYLVERIGGESVEVHSLVPAGADPHIYAPTGRQVRFISEADLYFATVMPFEQQNGSKLLASSKAQRVSLVDGLSLPVLEHVCCPHDGHHHHHHEVGGSDMDPHVWAAPTIVKLQVARMATELAARLPEASEAIMQRALALHAELEELDHAFATLAERSPFDKLLVYHPAWGYLCHVYGWEQVAVEREGKALSAREVAELMRSVDGAYFPMLLLQPQMQARMPQRFAEETGLKVETVDPLAYDYVAMLGAFLDLLTQQVDAAN